MMAKLEIALLVGLLASGVAARRRQTRDLATNWLFPFPDDSEKNTIVNGQNAAAGEFPYYAVFSGGVLCGGALVHEDIILTGE